MYKKLDIRERIDYNVCIRGYTGKVVHMSYHEKSTITSIATGILIIAAYIFYVISLGQTALSSSQDIASWAGVLLVFVGIGVGASIIIQIVFNILISIATAAKVQITSGGYDETKLKRTLDRDMATDEMDKLIDLKAMRIGYGVAGVGFIFALLSQVAGMPQVYLLHILFLFFSIGSIIEGAVKIFFYRRGISHG
jgi:hypothetical protein